MSNVDLDIPVSAPVCSDLAAIPYSSALVGISLLLVARAGVAGAPRDGGGLGTADILRLYLSIFHISRVTLRKQWVKCMSEPRRDIRHRIADSPVESRQDAVWTQPPDSGASHPMGFEGPEIVQASVF